MHGPARVRGKRDGEIDGRDVRGENGTPELGGAACARAQRSETLHLQD